MEWFTPVEFSGKKVIPFEVLPKRPQFSVPFVWITSTRLQVERKRKIYRYFVNGTTKCFCFPCPKKYQYHLTESFHRISLQMVSAPGQLKIQDRQVFPRSNKLNKETPRALKKQGPYVPTTATSVISPLKNRVRARPFQLFYRFLQVARLFKVGPTLNVKLFMRRSKHIE